MRQMTHEWRVVSYDVSQADTPSAQANSHWYAIQGLCMFSPWKGSRSYELLRECSGRNTVYSTNWECVPKRCERNSSSRETLSATRTVPVYRTTNAGSSLAAAGDSAVRYLISSV